MIQTEGCDKTRHKGDSSTWGAYMMLTQQQQLSSTSAQVQHSALLRQLPQHRMVAQGNLPCCSAQQTVPVACCPCEECALLCLWHEYSMAGTATPFRMQEPLQLMSLLPSKLCIWSGQVDAFTGCCRQQQPWQHPIEHMSATPGL
jgi:hypothetical protein